ncbi:MAG: glycerol-3-phosphate 1-O-acyltransferase PlsY [Syntrophorhabdales bacterium]|jgi:glycerol-3-phosphate acyltransferase PlsY
MVLSIAWVILSYLLGSVPVGLLLAKGRGADPRKVGSGNIGATNVMRAAGKVAGIVTLLCDVLKGFLPAWLAIRFGQPEGIVAAAGFAAFTGHLFPLYLKFRGGKGVATALGVFLALSPLAVLTAFIVFFGVLLAWGYVSLGSLCGAVLTPFALLALGAPRSYVLACAVMALLIVLKHKENIRRLLAGREHRVLRRGPGNL